MGWYRLNRVESSVEHGMESGRSGRRRLYVFDGSQDGGVVRQAFGVFELSLGTFLRCPSCCGNSLYSYTDFAAFSCLIPVALSTLPDLLKVELC